jgi:hypothetical protein
VFYLDRHVVEDERVEEFGRVPSAFAPGSLFDCAWCGYRAAAREAG